MDIFSSPGYFKIFLYFKHFREKIPFFYYLIFICQVLLREIYWFFRVVVIRNIFICKLSILTISSPFILINKKNV